MRTFFHIVFFGLLLLSSCKKDHSTISTTNHSDEPIQISDHALGEILNDFPVDLVSNSSQIVFEDRQGQELVFNIHFRRELKDMGSYEVEGIDVVYTGNVNVTYRFYTSLDARWSDQEEKFRESCTAMIVSDVSWKPTFVGTSVDDLLGMNVFHEELTLGNRTFQKVFTNSTQLDDENEDQLFKHLYYTKEKGIVGYTDEYEVLWVLKEFR